MARGSQIIYTPYFGYVVAQTNLAIGLASELMANDVEIWLPKSQVEDVHYDVEATDVATPCAKQSDKPRGEREQYEENTKLEGLELPRWLALEHGLDFDDDDLDDDGWRDHTWYD